MTDDCEVGCASGAVVQRLSHEKDFQKNHCTKFLSILSYSRDQAPSIFARNSGEHDANRIRLQSKARLIALSASPPTLTLSRPADENSNRRRKWSRRSRVAEDSPAIAENSAPTAATHLSTVNDKYAEWDCAETIDAVERALEGVGEVVRLEATEDFPERLRLARPDIVFNIAEGMNGANREAHVPGDLRIPTAFPTPAPIPSRWRWGSIRRARRRYLAYNRVPTAPFVLVRSAHEVTALLERVTTRRLRGVNGRLRLPLFVKPVHEGSSKGITEAEFLPHAGRARRADALPPRAL